MSYIRGNYGPKTDSKNFCAVCGDKARGCNFDAITCASCKEFFRRNAFKEKNLKCYFQGSCRIDIVSRRFCASCRLRKCFSAGMKREYIMSEDEREARKSKILEKRQMRDVQVQGQFPFVKNSFLPTLNLCNEICASPIITPPRIPSPHEENMIFKFTDLNMFSPNIEHFNFDMIEDKKFVRTLEKNPELEITNLINKIKVIRESNYYPTKYALLCRAKNAKKVLSPDEKHKLKQLTCIVQAMQVETIYQLPLNEKFIDVVRFTAIITENLVKMCKKLSDFYNLNVRDQVTLVQGGCMETLILRSIMILNLEKECWEVMDMEKNCKFSFKMEILKQANSKVYESHRKYALSFEPEWRFDDNLMSLLIAIAIFDPDRENLIEIEKISQIQNNYLNLMKKYLEIIYDEEKAHSTFKRLQEQLKFTKKTSEIHVQAYFDSSPEEMGQCGISLLLMDIFDLNKTD